MLWDEGPVMRVKGFLMIQPEIEPAPDKKDLIEKRLIFNYFFLKKANAGKQRQVA